jgi:TRAP-type C4-dicarboxylate transport system permease small subunit
LDGEQVNNSNEFDHDVADFSPREITPPTPPKGLIGSLEKALAIFSKLEIVVAGVALLAMLVVSVVDVAGNKIFHQPLQGTSEYVSFLALITTAFAVTYSIIEKAHVQVDIFIDKLPVRVKASVELFVMMASLGLFILLGWSSIRYGIKLYSSNTLSMTQRIPIYPFAYAIAFACVPTAMYMLLEFLKWGKKVVKK